MKYWNELYNMYNINSLWYIIDDAACLKCYAIFSMNQFVPNKDNVNKLKFYLNECNIAYLIYKPFNCFQLIGAIMHRYKYVNNINNINWCAIIIFNEHFFFLNSIQSIISKLFFFFFKFLLIYLSATDKIFNWTN